MTIFGKVSWNVILLLILVVELGLFGFAEPYFVQPVNLLFNTSDFIHIALVALPLTLVLIGGGIDVSFGSTIGLSSIVLGFAFTLGLNIWLAAIIAILVGGIAGTINGLIITFTKVQPLVITLATLYLYSGVAVVISGSLGADGYEGISGFPAAFSNLANLTYGGFPLPLVIFVFLALAFSVFLHQTRTGRYIYLTGINPVSARFTAIPAKQVVILTYAFVGFVSGVAGVLLTSYFASARADIAATALLPTITVVVLGGASIYGGTGSILGTVIAAFIMGYLQQGLQILGISSLVSSTLSGVLLIVVILGKNLFSTLYEVVTRRSLLRSGR